MSARRRGARQISEIANGMLDPILARRAGINTLLLGAWDEIAGAEFADCSRPERIVWARSAASEEGGFTPGALVVACEGARALFLMHQQDQLIERINAFFGFPAVARVRIVQKPVSPSPRRPRLRPASPEEKARVAQQVREIEDPRLREALSRLGEAIAAGKRPLR